MKSKKFLTTAMVFTMAVTMWNPVSTVTVKAAPEVSVPKIETGKCGDEVIYKYDSNKSRLTISGKGDMWDDSGITKIVKNVESVIIESGVTSIGEYAFEGVENIENFTIPTTVTTIKEYAIPYIDGMVVIPASVTKIEKNAIAGAKTIEFMGDVSGFEPTIAWDSRGFNNVILHGDAKCIGTSLASVSVNRVTIAENNTKCKINNGCLLSSDGKTLYKYVGTRDEIKIQESVVTIAQGAFYGQDVSNVTLGENVENIGAFSFYNSGLQTINTNTKLKSIGCGAFRGSYLKKLVLAGKVKLGVDSVNYNTEVKCRKGLMTAQSSVVTADLNNGKYRVRYAKIAGAKGYQIKIKYKKKTSKYFTSKRTFTKSAPANVKESYDVEKNYSLYDNEYLKKTISPVTVSVRPYKIVKGKKVYGRWSASRVVKSFS